MKTDTRKYNIFVEGESDLTDIHILTCIVTASLLKFTEYMKNTLKYV